MNQPYIYIYPLTFGFPSNSGHHRALSRFPSGIQGALISYLFYESESVNHWVESDSLPPMACSLLVSSVHGILQSGILEWVAIPFSRRSSWPSDQIQFSCTAGRLFTIWAMRQCIWVNPNLPIHPTPSSPWCPYICSLCLYFCFASRFIYTIFLDYTYMHYYTILFFSFWLISLWSQFLGPFTSLKMAQFCSFYGWEILNKKTKQQKKTKQNKQTKKHFTWYMAELLLFSC